MSETLRILVVDDEEGMRAGVARALRDFTVATKHVNGQCGFLVDQAASGEEAMAMLLPGGSPPPNPAAHVDILLLDHKLPGMTGLDVLDRVVGKLDNMATVMITAYASLETAVSAIKRGAYDFLAKPFTPQELKNTVRKAAESIILARQARRLAQEKRQVRFQFITVLAHELKAPLSAIEGYLHILKDRSAGNDQAVYDHMLARSLIRLEGMRKLIGDLLDLTRIESGQKKRELSLVDVRELAKAAIEGVAQQAAGRKIAVTLKADGPVVMEADRGEIDIILNNLISNAVKYNRDGGNVTAELSRTGAKVTISVADTGIGMSHEERQRLFSDFVRIKTEKTRNILGSGLGLSIVKKLADLYGGDVAVASEPDVGSTFTVTLMAGPQGTTQDQTRE